MAYSGLTRSFYNNLDAQKQAAIAARQGGSYSTPATTYNPATAPYLGGAPTYNQYTRTFLPAPSRDVQPVQRDYLLNYAAQQSGRPLQEIEALAANVPSLAQNYAAAGQQAQVDYESLLAEQQRLTQEQINSATAPLLQTIKDLQGELLGTAAANEAAIARSDAARQTAAINQSRAGASSNLQIQPASSSTGSSSASDAFKINRARRQYSAPLSDVLPSAINI